MKFGPAHIGVEFWWRKEQRLAVLIDLRYAVPNAQVVFAMHEGNRVFPWAEAEREFVELPAGWIVRGTAIYRAVSSEELAKL